MGVYLLLIVGVTTSVTGAATDCTAWPACGSGWSLPLTMDGWVAIGHRAVGAIVGVTMVATAIVAWREGVSRRILIAVFLALVLYPPQAAVGAIVATSGTTPIVPWLHLAGGIVIFAALLAALAWWLEAETGDPDDTPDTVRNLSPPGADAPGDAATGGVAGASGRTPQLPERRIGRLKLTLSAYFRLMKPRLMWLLCLVAAAAMALAGGPGLTTYAIAATLVGGALAIGASGTFNHVLERDRDRRMQRTSDRPLATDLVSVPRAIVFGFVLAGVSLWLFWTVEPLAAVLGAVAIVFYSVVYTLILKPNTVQNTVIGGAAGALPALIGWAAVTGEIGLGAIVLAALIFLWTPAHFYNLALAYKDDYERGGFPMMPVVRGETTTRRHIVWYFGATLVAAAVLAASSTLGWLYVAVGVGLGAVFLWAIVRLHYEQTESAAFRAFHASNAYLGLVLFAIVFEGLAF